MVLGGGGDTQFIIDQWTPRRLTALGTQNTPGVWVQLFVNGLYWGLYNACAHIDPKPTPPTSTAARPSNYDVIHCGSSFEVMLPAPWTAWDAMFNVARYGNVAGTGTMSPTTLASSTAYALMAAVPQPARTSATTSSPTTTAATGTGTTHNYSWIYNTASTTGSVFQDWDGEGILRSHHGNISSRDTNGGPTELFVALLANADFRQMLADHVYRDLTTALSPTSAAATYQTLANTISTSVVDESARWGNIASLNGTSPGFQGTPAMWSAGVELARIGSLFPNRTNVMFSQFEDDL